MAEIYSRIESYEEFHVQVLIQLQIIRKSISHSIIKSFFHIYIHAHLRQVDTKPIYRLGNI